MENKVISKEYVEKNYIYKDIIRDLIKNEIIDIAGFKCIAVEDIIKILKEE